MSPSLCCHYLSPRGPPDRLILCEQARPTFHISYVHRSRTRCVVVLEEDFENGSRWSLMIFFLVLRANNCTTLLLFTGGRLLSVAQWEVGGNGLKGGFRLDEVLNAVASIHLRLPFLCERENEDFKTGITILHFIKSAGWNCIVCHTIMSEAFWFCSSLEAHRHYSQRSQWREKGTALKSQWSFHKSLPGYFLSLKLSECTTDLALHKENYMLMLYLKKNKKNPKTFLSQSW